MSDVDRAVAREPQELARFFNERANAGDVEGLVALYEPDAVVAVGGVVAEGQDAIRGFYADLLSKRREFPAAEVLEPLVQGDVALTFARSANGNLSVEAARRQSDGQWLWFIDQLRVPRPEQGGRG